MSAPYLNGAATTDPRRRQNADTGALFGVVRWARRWGEVLVVLGGIAAATMHESVALRELRGDLRSIDVRVAQIEGRLAATTAPAHPPPAPQSPRYLP